MKVPMRDAKANPWLFDIVTWGGGDKGAFAGVPPSKTMVCASIIW